MSTLDTDKNKIIYLIISIIVLLFSIIYEWFSHGVYSIFMITAFLIPLIFGVLLPIVLKKMSYLSINFYHSFIATLTITFIVKGFLDIYGTTNSLIYIYIVISSILFILSLLFKDVGDHE